ncbi:SDR family oxidoreductase [Luethyella okanaganae]|uniref:SDR family oxidoreductase n=1 Tax=Luethyella okanaganae TaxID=69372 RepID=A0ABW1V907_9MICO
MSLVVTGATGSLGRHVIETLLAKGTPADTIVAAGRNPERLAELAARGVKTAQIDYARPETLEGVFDGADAVLLVSGSEVGQRVQQHANAIAAAVSAGVGRIVYTSAPRADVSELVLAPEHKATEQLIRESGIPATILRNGWYTENYVQALQQARETGVVVASVGDGRVASASRSDYAEAAAIVLADESHVGKVYELSGDVAWNYDELASTIGDIVGREVVFRSVTPEEHAAILAEAGLDEGTIGFVVALDANTRDGLLAETSGDLARLLGRPTTPLREGLLAAI